MLPQCTIGNGCTPLGSFVSSDEGKAKGVRLSHSIHLTTFPINNRSLSVIKPQLDPLN